MDENFRRVLSEVGPFSHKDTLPGGILIFGSLNYLKMHIIIIINWFASDVTAAMLVETLFSCKSFEIIFIVLTTNMAANCHVIAN